jgi:hypothetical protein
MYRVLVLLPLLFLVNCAGGLHAADRFSDEPEKPREAIMPFKAADSYQQALQMWKTPEDINGWINANFSYDTARAIELSETQRTKNGRIAIHPPSAFFENKTGVCVDLARFGLETLRSIDPHSDPKYLMIEFEPMQVQGNTLRLHWLVSFRREGKIYLFADSKRPGHMAGPYNDMQAFIAEYEQYRGRKIVTFRELDSYEKQRRIQAQKQQRQRSPNVGTEPMR